MKLIFISTLSLAVLGGPLRAGDPRVFTDITGRTLSAEVVAATADTVTLKMADGTTPTIAQSRLSEADRTFLQAWMKANAGTQATPAPAVPAQPAAKASFKVEWTPERLSRKLRATDRSLFGMHEDWVCHFKVTNLGREPVANVRVDYVVHCEMRNVKRVQKGTQTLESIGGFQSLKVDSDSLTMSATAYQKYKQGTGTIESVDLIVEKIEGVEVTVFVNDTEVHRYVSPGIRSSVPKAGGAR